MSLKIQIVDRSEQEAWREVGQRSFLHNEVGYAYEDILPMAPGVIRIGGEPSNVHLIAFDKEVAVGRALVQTGQQEYVLRDIAVVPDARRHGVGRALVEDAMRRVPDKGQLQAETDLEDLTMYRFLSACGFERKPTFGYGAWGLMAYAYKERTLARVRAIEDAGIEIREPGIDAPAELARAAWAQRPVNEEDGQEVPAARIEEARRFLACGGRTFFAYQGENQIGTTMGVPQANTYSGGRFFRDTQVGTLIWIESRPGMRQRGLATALVYHLMESFRGDGSRFFYYRGVGYGMKSYRVGMGMGRAYLRTTVGWSRPK